MLSYCKKQKQKISLLEDELKNFKKLNVEESPAIDNESKSMSQDQLNLKLKEIISKYKILQERYKEAMTQIESKSNLTDKVNVLFI